MTPTTRPALTEPATEAGRAHLDRTAPAPPATAQELHRRAAEGRRAETRKAILAIEAEAAAAAREALVETVATVICDDRDDCEFPYSPCQDGRAEARRLLGLDK